jgi:hypothetical protein
MNTRIRRLGIAIIIAMPFAFFTYRVFVIEIWVVPEVVGVVEESDKPEVPLHRATIILIDQDGTEYRAYTDELGRFRLRGVKKWAVGPSLDRVCESTLSVTRVNYKTVTLKVDISHAELGASRPPTIVIVGVRLASTESRNDSVYGTYSAMVENTVLPEWASSLKSLSGSNSPSANSVNDLP